MSKKTRVIIAPHTRNAMTYEEALQYVPPAILQAALAHAQAELPYAELDDERPRRERMSATLQHGFVRAENRRTPKRGYHDRRLAYQVRDSIRFHLD